MTIEPEVDKLSIGPYGAGPGTTEEQARDNRRRDAIGMNDPDYVAASSAAGDLERRSKRFLRDRLDAMTCEDLCEHE